MLTGKLNGISRAEAKSLIEENSGTTVSSVSKKLNYLIVGEKPTKRKIEIAKELNIKIIDQTEWLKMLNKTKKLFIVCKFTVRNGKWVKTKSKLGFVIK